MIKKRDIIFISIILAFSLALLLLYFILGEIGSGSMEKYDRIYVTVEVDGKEIARYDITEDGEYPLNGGTNILKIEQGSARIIDAACPDLLCVGMGNVSAAKPIVCLPNRLTVTLHGGSDGVDLVN